MDLKIIFETRKFKNHSPSVFFTDRTKVDDFASTINNLPKNSTIIIREYDLDKKARENFALEIKKLAQKKKFKILVGKDLNLAKKIKADGVHFSDFDNLSRHFLKKIPQNFIFSLSCHSLKSFLQARKLSPDMIFISPIFKTTSHKNSKLFSLRNLAKIAIKYKKTNSIFALGGINILNLGSIRKLGISGFGAIDIFKKAL